ncbi:MAG: FHA domain-containing protein [Gemmatimonadetes bacterium]|nr:FHA domain-containing protein [Gemmatimonadota bacterium]
MNVPPKNVTQPFASVSSADTRPCPSCQVLVAQAYAFCPSCGSSVGGASAGRKCPSCDTDNSGNAKFCSQCGQGFEGSSDEIKPMELDVLAANVVLVQLDETGSEVGRHTIGREETTIGRGPAEIVFADDEYLSPMHARLNFTDGKLEIRDLGSRNGTWFFIESPQRLQDGDKILVGSQVISFRRLGYPGPNPPELDATRRLGSLTPQADIACLTQHRADGSSRDSIHLSPGRNVIIGRDTGDWLFPYDPSMSGKHAEIRSEDADFVVADGGSRNGTAVSVRGDVTLKNGSRFLVGDKLLRVEMQ